MTYRYPPCSITFVTIRHTWQYLVILLRYGMHRHDTATESHGYPNIRSRIEDITLYRSFIKT